MWTPREYLFNDGSVPFREFVNSNDIWFPIIQWTTLNEKNAFCDYLDTVQYMLCTVT
jgi:hypothetical protein